MRSLWWNILVHPMEINGSHTKKCALTQAMNWLYSKWCGIIITYIIHGAKLSLVMLESWSIYTSLYNGVFPDFLMLSAILK